MQQVLTAVLPLLVAGTALVTGAFTGRAVANRFQLRSLSMFSLLLVVFLCALGAQLSSATIMLLMKAGVPSEFARYIAVAFLCFVSGFALVSTSGGRKKQP